MKKIILFICLVMSICAFAGCSSDTNKNNGNSEAPATAETEQDTESSVRDDTGAADITEDLQTENEETNETGDPEGEKTLVVYYSASGYTEAVAEIIAEEASADLFEIVPAQSYTDADLDWTDRNSRVSREYGDESLRDVELVSTTIQGWEEYDTVFIGYPIWWGIAAWPMNSFVEVKDFAGKKVIPFCTSSSSGFGASGELLAEQAGTGDWQEGIRFRSNVASKDVVSWVEKVLGE